MEFIERARAIIPDVEIAGDIIVGFCTETEEDYESTRALLEKVRFKNNFVFHYSPRPGTVAIDRFEDDVPRDVKKRRLNALLDLGQRISGEVHQSYEGKVIDVFVEKLSPQTVKKRGVELKWEETSVQLSGRTSGDLICVFEVDSAEIAEQMLGTIVQIEITGSAPLLLQGVLRTVIMSK